MFILIFVLYIWLLVQFLNHKRYVASIPTTSGSIVMSMGILFVGVIPNMPFFTVRMGQGLVIILGSIYGMIISRFLMDLKKKIFFENHLKDPVNSFTIGTWVAATSIIVLNIHYFSLRLVMETWVLYSIALIIWFVYLGVVVRNYIVIMRDPTYFNKVQGGILLPSVATQSLVIAGTILFKTDIPVEVELGMVGIGLILYMISIILIILSFTKRTINYTILNWENTNCIIHGALSSTGFVLCLNNSSLGKWLVYFWLFVSVILFLVEWFEFSRSIIRIKNFGIEKGIFVYHPSQWSRNFTLGMYVNFTNHLPNISLLESARTTVVTIGKYIVFILFIVEVLIYMKNKLLVPEKYHVYTKLKQ